MTCLGAPGTNSSLTSSASAGGWSDVQDSGAVAEALVWGQEGVQPSSTGRSPKEAPGRLPGLGTHPRLGREGTGRSPSLCQRHCCSLGMAGCRGAAMPALPPRQGLSQRGRRGLKRSREMLDPLDRLIGAEQLAHSLAASAGIHLDGAAPGGCSA